MTINSLLLKPFLTKLQQEFERIFREIGFETNEDAAELKVFIQERLQQIAVLKAAVADLERGQETLVPSKLHASLKQIKLDLRFSQRTRERIFSNQERIRKMQERRAHVAIFAA